jgi:hypothetical protein
VAAFTSAGSKRSDATFDRRSDLDTREVARFLLGDAHPDFDSRDTGVRISGATVPMHSAVIWTPYIALSCERA